MADHVEDAITMQYIGAFPYPIAPWPLAGSEGAPRGIDILDVRGNEQDLDMASEIKSRLKSPCGNGPRYFPSSLLWNGQGIEQFEKMTTHETNLLEKHVDEIAMSLLPGTILIDVEASSPQKIRTLLEAIESHHKIVDYYALGVDRDHLERIMKDLDFARFNYVRVHGLLGSHDHARAWVAKYENKQRPVCVLSLGGKISSLDREATIAFWRQWSDLLTINNKFNSNNARVILGIESCKDMSQVHAKDQNRQTFDRQCLRNVFENANVQLGHKAFEPSDWTIQGEWESSGKTYTQYLLPEEDVRFDNITLKAGEKIVIAYYNKYDDREKARLFQESKLKELQRHTSDDGSYDLHILAPC